MLRQVRGCDGRKSSLLAVRKVDMAQVLLLSKKKKGLIIILETKSYNYNRRKEKHVL